MRNPTSTLLSALELLAISGLPKSETRAVEVAQQAASAC
jgi:hypothetical protein